MGVTLGSIEPQLLSLFLLLLLLFVIILRHKVTDRVLEIILPRDWVSLFGARTEFVENGDRKRTFCPRGIFTTFKGPRMT